MNTTSMARSWLFPLGFALIAASCSSANKALTVPEPPATSGAATAPPRNATMVGQQCCCEFIVEGDILKEDLRSPDACRAEERGMCIQVDPGRGTPHACCPDATGSTCG
jgi:hypothetical protein